MAAKGGREVFERVEAKVKWAGWFVIVVIRG